MSNTNFKIGLSDTNKVELTVEVNFTVHRIWMSKSYALWLGKTITAVANMIADPPAPAPSEPKKKR